MMVPESQEGIEYLNNLISELSSKSEEFGEVCEKLSSSVANRADGLQGYEPQIQDVVTEIRTGVNNAAEGIRGVAADLQKVLALIEAALAL